LRGRVELAKARVREDRYEQSIGRGQRAVLTLVPAIQQAAEQVLERSRAIEGAVVVLATDGRILALAGRSTLRAAQREYSRPLEVWAPAASVFKIVTAAALVDAGVKPSTSVCFRGGLRSVDPHHLMDDPRRDKECDDLAAGLARSQNAVIAKLAHRHLRPNVLSRFARAFGFASNPPVFALPLDANRAEIPETDIDFARVAAGFWKTELSPLGGALLVNTIATRGLSVTPRIVDRVLDARGEQVRIVGEAPRRVIPARIASAVSAMMVGTVERGTARVGFYDRRGRPFLKDVAVAGKTGSLSKDGPDYIAYSWFVGFAPADQPRFAIAVLLGNPAKWYLKAHTAARMVLQAAL
jgi:penicillin-binding protein A